LFNLKKKERRVFENVLFKNMFIYFCFVIRYSEQIRFSAHPLVFNSSLHRVSTVHTLRLARTRH